MWGLAELMQYVRGANDDGAFATTCGWGGSAGSVVERMGPAALHRAFWWKCWASLLWLHPAAPRLRLTTRSRVVPRRQLRRLFYCASCPNPPCTHPGPWVQRRSCGEAPPGLTTSPWSPTTWRCVQQSEMTAYIYFVSNLDSTSRQIKQKDGFPAPPPLGGASSFPHYVMLRLCLAWFRQNMAALWLLPGGRALTRTGAAKEGEAAQRGRRPCVSHLRLPIPSTRPSQAARPLRLPHAAPRPGTPLPGRSLPWTTSTRKSAWLTSCRKSTRQAARGMPHASQQHLSCDAKVEARFYAHSSESRATRDAVLSKPRHCSVALIRSCALHLARCRRATSARRAPTRRLCASCACPAGSALCPSLTASPPSSGEPM